MYNSTTISFKCGSNYNLISQLLIYFVNASYLGVGVFLHILILRVLLFKERQIFRNNSFFQIYVMDSIASTFLLLTDMFFVRLFMYVPPLCAIISPFFWDPSITTKFVILVVMLPFIGTWNVIISRVFVFPSDGGFAMNYIRNVEWAVLSLFQSIFIFTALGFTIVCTSITLYGLFVLPDRIKSAEKTLCFTSLFVSLCFLLVGVLQV
nr:hypothetical protein T01B7.2 - Caenorhabditis elegans [Caenorhabditis elegans]